MSDSIYAGCRKVAEAANEPWTDAKRVYTDLQTGGLLPKSAGRRIWGAHVGLISTFIFALSTRAPVSRINAMLAAHRNIRLGRGRLSMTQSLHVAFNELLVDQDRLRETRGVELRPYDYIAARIYPKCGKPLVFFGDGIDLKSPPVFKPRLEISADFLLAVSRSVDFAPAPGTTHDNDELAEG